MEEKSLNELIESKDNISEQLKLLRKHREREDVKEYINSLLENRYVTDYVRYMIDKYYFNNKEAVKVEKNSIERVFKVLLRPVKVKTKKYAETNIKVGDNVSIVDGPFNGFNGIVEKVDNEYAEFAVLINLFEDFFTVQVEFEFVIKK